MLISIIIPAYNEEKRIGKTLTDYLEFFEKKRKTGNIDYEIIVAINNTTDKTPQIVNSFKRKNKRVNCLNLPEKGKGYAVIEGFKYALRRKNDLIGFVDADMATSPEEYYKLINKIDKIDGVIASRWVNGAKVMPKPKFRRMVARFMFNTLIRSLLFLPFRDTQCGAKIFRTRVIKTIVEDITMSQWAFDVDLLYACKKKGFKIKEIPSEWNDREYSTINFWKAGPKMALGVIRLRILNSPLRDFIRIYNFLK